MRCTDPGVCDRHRSPGLIAPSHLNYFDAIMPWRCCSCSPRRSTLLSRNGNGTIELKQLRSYISANIQCVYCSLFPSRHPSHPFPPPWQAMVFHSTKRRFWASSLCTFSFFAFIITSIYRAGFLLIAVLLNAYFFGAVSQQLYRYWNGRFGDLFYVKAFVVAQFVVVVVQGVMFWHLAWDVYIVDYNLIVTTQVRRKALAISLCQLVLFIMANAFLIVRLYSLRCSRLQSGLVLGFSSAAFIVGIVNLSMTWKAWPTLGDPSASQRATSIVWHVSQTIAECLLMVFLSQALLASPDALKKSDSIAHHLVRNFIQVGLLATIWSIAVLGTYLLLSHRTVYNIFDMTSGLIYTHMLYDVLLSRTRPHDITRSIDQSRSEPRLPSQSLSRSSHLPTFNEKRTTGMNRGHGSVSFVNFAGFGTSTLGQDASDPSGLGPDTNSEFESDVAVRSAAGFGIAK
ncbi:hypothetical protein F5148DRAFT_1219262 [Russula earlei]|uniref:Uncharacterized protein n=1 Tax=Russula earlei TaxID=71964 RepID=A0ACC0U2J9_9AGAM|nr:hypothetical protein F5148DRAFT_1219262 [Russula earlei]